MDIKKINKKGSLTLTSLIMGLIIAIGMFSAFFLFFNQQVELNGGIIDDKYNETYNLLIEEQNQIDSNVDDIRNNVASIKEADNTFLAAWNGFKALGATLLLPISFIDSSWNVVTAFLFSTDILPTQQQVLILIAIVAAVVLLILAILKGEPRV